MCRAFARLVLPLFLLVILVSAAAARDVIPAPPVADPTSIHPEDNAPPFGTGPWRERLEPPLPVAADKAVKLDDIGGDDVFVFSHSQPGQQSMDIADDGDIFLATEVRDPVSGREIQVRRSQDGGASWEVWGTIANPDPSIGFRHPHLDVVEGSVARCIVAYARVLDSGDDTIELVYASPAGATASWSSPVTVMAASGVEFDYPRFDTDVTSYSSFYVYVVAQGDDGNGGDIWFARSVNQGGSFEAEYQLGTLTPSDREYIWPDIAYGFGQHLHVTWTFHSRDGSFDDSIRYRRANSFASGGIADWDYWITLTSTTNGIDEWWGRIEAGAASNHVVIVYPRIENSSPRDPGSFLSTDAGTSFGAEQIITNGIIYISDVLEGIGTGTWYLGGAMDGIHPSVQKADVADLTSWGPAEEFTDVDQLSFYLFMPGFALDPTRGWRSAIAWDFDGEPGNPDPNQIWFDAEWRSDPGYPNLEPGFPLPLTGAPISPPAVVDLDGDGDLEIVWSDQDYLVQARHHDGSSLSGWPVDAGVALSHGPVAVGDLDGDGAQEVAVGTAGGFVHLYDRTGALLPGWPVDLGDAAPAYVSIGALGGPYHRTIVAGAGEHLRYLSRSGTPVGTVGWNFPGRDISVPASFGDVDDDGITEIVAPVFNGFYVLDKDVAVIEAGVGLGVEISDAVSLADLDLDGDLEIVIPRVDGVLDVYDHTGSPVGGNFPFDTGTAYPLTSVAVAQCLGTGEPELAFATQDYTVHLLWHDGVEQTGYPVQTGSGWWIWAAPVIGRVDGSSSDVVIGARDRTGWAWDNFSQPCDGWPKFLDDQVELSPAMGDLDLDGSVEIVFLGLHDLFVLDINNLAATASRTWPMDGHDPQRTGCSNCPEDLVTAVDPGPAGEEPVTRVSFAGAFPNPVFGSTQFCYAVPSRAVVSLEIYDIRGRRVSTVLREETGPGADVIVWHGRDERGEPVASGQYLARLKVTGPGISEVLTRKITILR